MCRPLNFERGSKHDEIFRAEHAAGFGDRFIAFANNKVSDVSGLVAAYLLVPLVVVFLIEIVSRNVFNHPTTWASGTCFHRRLRGRARLRLRDEKRRDGAHRRAVVEAAGKRRTAF